MGEGFCRGVPVPSSIVWVANSVPDANIETMKPKTRYTFLGFYLVSLLDSGRSLGWDETIKHIEDGSLFVWLKDQFGDDIDLSLYRPEDEQVMLDLFLNLANAVDARRKFGVEHNGLALLAAYCLEAIQELEQ
jgi:hypothetical protein